MVIIGATIAGYALASVYKANEIRKSDCDKLKAAYKEKSNLPMVLLGLSGIVIMLVGVYGGQQ